MRVLVVEDCDEVYEYYLRLFASLLPVTEIEFSRAGDMEAALDRLAEDWDVVLMDFSLGREIEKDGLIFRTGSDLITFRRGLERKGSSVSLILGTATTEVHNECLKDSGADFTFLKLYVPEMAKEIERVLNAQQQRV